MMPLIPQSRAGMTLLELTFVMAIMTVVMGILFSLSLSIGDTARIQDVKVTANDEGRRALLSLIPRLRQAQRVSINTLQMPTDILVFRMARDLDGNGLAVNALNQLELGEPITVMRDSDDLNGDGVTMTQLIMIDGDTITVLANNLSPDPGPPPVEVDAAPPENHAGFWVDEIDGRIAVTIRTQGKTRRGHVLRQQFTQLVEPRN